MQQQLILNQAIADGLDVIGDKWTILILRSAFYGIRRFDDFQAATGASRSTLTRRLAALIEHEILYKHPYTQAGNRFEYKFTEKGLGLLGPSLLAAQWESDWQTSGYVNVSKRLVHSQCQQAMTPKVVCAACRECVQFSEVSWPNFSELLDQQLAEIRTYNTQHRKRVSIDAENELANLNLASLIGDRWTLIVLIAAFFGTRRYDDFINRLSTPPSVLSERLKQLVANNIFKRELYQQKPPRHDYKLTPKGQALFPFVMSLRQWVASSVADAQVSGPLIHSVCNSPLKLEIVCDQCEQKPWLSDLSFISAK